MAPRSKTGGTHHELRNAYLRNRVKKVIASDEESFVNFIQHLNRIGNRQNKWYKATKDVPRSISSWLRGETLVYWWVLNVIELAAIDMEAAKRGLDDGSEAQQLDADTQQQIEPAEARTISAGTQGELDALRDIVTLFVPLKEDARQRVLAYLGSL
jgi:hypothetical protein